ncbi:hypothetical protein [Streptomyces sp. NPDC097610]|uniref:hypothetical protein n=1 Tax=Streptomyces sp. NPDC097610 TaxID=3157227 RepID=UPI003330ED7D
MPGTSLSVITHENAPATTAAWQRRGDQLFAQGERLLAEARDGSTGAAKVAEVHFQAATAAWNRAATASR